MPIKWKQFNDSRGPVNAPDVFGEDEWVPFVPTFRPDEPAIDIYQDKNNLYVEIPLVGIKPENVEVSIDNNILTIQGKIEEKKQIKEKDYLRKEIRRGSFRRVIKLPVEVKEGKAMAESSGGILKITIPKTVKTSSKTKRVPIKIK
ncbi:MAG: Hsp20/alpha crystallin family protein [Patescibacteria group bacterium]